MTIRKYATIFGIASRDQFVYLPAFLVRNVFFLIILFIFFSLWRAIYGGSQSLAGFTMAQMLWYLTFTEAIEMSQTRIFYPISPEVKDGTIAYTLSRPYSYTLYWITRGMGENLVKVVPLLIEGFILAVIMVGLLAFWFEEVSPFWWINQKPIFVIGGLFIPIDLYPEWLQRIARVTPFAFAAYWPATTWTTGSPQRCGSCMCREDR